MKNSIKKLYHSWIKFSQIIGNLISALILFIFYFTLWALISIPYKFLTKNYFNYRKIQSSFVEKRKNLTKVDDFQQE